MSRPKTYATKTPGIRKDDQGRFWISAKIGGQKIWKLCGTKSAATSMLTKLRHEAEQKRLFPERYHQGAKGKNLLLLSELFDRYRKEDEAHNKTSSRNAAYERKWIETLGAETRVGEITIPVITAQQREWLKEGYAAGTINRWCSRIRRVFTLATRDGLIDTNPLAGMPKLREPPTKFRVLSREEESRLREVMPHWAWRYVLFALLSGCRKEEQFTMKVSQIDLESNTIQIPRSKSSQSRTLSMSRRLRTLVEELIEESGSEWLFPNRSRQNHDDARNFTVRWFRKGLAEAGIEDFTWHDLRRTCGSRLAEAGVRARSIQKWLGHSNITTTERYMVTTQDHLAEIASLQDKVGPTVGSPSANPHKT